jgi:hypothetical protein
MRLHRSHSLALVAALAVFPVAGASAEDRCLARGKMQDQSFELRHCAVAMYDNASVTIWLTEKPLPAETVDTFHLNSYADLKGTAMSVALCPGGGKPAVNPKAVGDVAFDVNHAASPMVSQSFLFPAKTSRDLKIEKLTGELKPGGKLAGKMKVDTKLDRGQAYSWELEFDVTLPAKNAAAGMGCGQ